jgi:galactonate dehydratase
MPGHIALRRMRLSALAQAGRGVAGDSPAAKPELAVDDMKVYALREPVSRRSYTVLEVHTKGGLTGWGECSAASSEALALAKQTTQGQAATSYEVISRQLAVYPGMQAAVVMALLDITGKYAKAPVYQTLGGPTRNKARALTPLSGATDGELAASMKRARGAGHRAFLVPAPASAAANQGQAFVRATHARLESLRAEGGPDVDFVLDGGGRLTPGDSASLAAALERFHLLWFDEPCRTSNISTLHKIAGESVTPLGFGRRIHQGGAFQDLLRDQVIDVLRPSLALNGLSQLRRMAALAETYYTAIAPYHEGGPISTAAALHLAASLPNFFIQQLPLTEAPEDRAMRASLGGASLEKPVDGFLSLPTGPGLGVTIDRGALEKFRERAV